MDAYLARIGAQRPDRPDEEALRRLHRAHLGAVPFENLSIHLGEPITLDETAVLDKVVGRRRGGFCYELNGAFAALLSALGYRVTMHSARVYGDGRYGPPFDHLLLRVELDERWLADVGFGRFSHAPLRWDDRAPQADPGGMFLLTGDGDLDVFLDGEPQYRVDPRPYELADFVPTCWWQQTSPLSHFTGMLTCSRLTGDGGRVTLSGTRLIRTDGTARTEEDLGEDAAVLAAYREHFGVILDRVPRVASL
ncbi:arylamine N-acetyltransferase [Phytohabitans rumicis]